MKEIDLTGIVAEHIDTINAADTDRAVATFAEDAYVNDNHRAIGETAFVRNTSLDDFPQNRRHRTNLDRSEYGCGSLRLRRSA
jgi:hypothetical protein